MTPESLGHYRLLDRIGTAGMGETYRARDTRAGRTVAITLVSPEFTADADGKRRLIEDARAATALSHPNVAALYEVGEDQGALFLASEFVPGEPLGQVIGGRPLNPRRAADFALQLADALADAHAHGWTHGFLTPDTIVVTPKGNAKILAVGLAPRLASDSTRATPYDAPEKKRGEATDERSDLFSLGTLLCEMLTGRPGAAAGAAPEELNAVVVKATAARADERYQSAASMAADVRAAIAALDSKSTSAAPAPRPAARPRQRRSRAVWVGVILAFAAIAALVWAAIRAA